MAEEQLAPAEGGEEQVVAPEEGVSPAPVTIEDFARERGWKPKEEFEGKEEDWRDAGSFIAFGMDRNRELMRDIKELRTTTERMARTQAEVTAQAVESARNEERQSWEERHQRAVEEGDLSTATRAVQKIAELAAKPVQQASDPAVDAFARDNAWFSADASARAVAIAAADEVAARKGSVDEQLRAAKEAVHKRFPEYAPQPAKPAPAVAAPGARTVDTRGRKKGFSDMPAEAQQACRELVKRGFATQDGYVSQYFNQGAA